MCMCHFCTSILIINLIVGYSDVIDCCLLLEELISELMSVITFKKTISCYW